MCASVGTCGPASSILSTCSWSSTIAYAISESFSTNTNSAAGASWYIGTGIPPSACAASIDQYRRGRLSPMIARCIPRRNPCAASPQASARTSSATCRHVQVCQMPRSFSRVAGWSGRTSAWCSRRRGKVSGSVRADGSATTALLQVCGTGSVPLGLACAPRLPAVDSSGCGRCRGSDSASRPA